MAEVNASDNSFFFFFYHTVSFLQRRSMKTDMVETSKVWRSSLPRKPSCRVHLRYTLLSASHTQTHTQRDRALCTHTHANVARPLSIFWRCIQSQPPAVVTAVVFSLWNHNHSVTHESHLPAGSTEGQQLGEVERQDITPASLYRLWSSAWKHSRSHFIGLIKCLYLIWLFL